MATRNDSRGTRRSGRSGGNRPRTHPTPEARRKPVPPKPSKLHTAADALRDARHVSSHTRLAEQFRVNPTQAVREMRNGVPATVLRQISRELEVAQAVVYLCAATLRGQAADSDIDVALSLQRCVGDELDRQIERIGELLEGGV
jgi:hypothetical protein